MKNPTDIADSPDALAGSNVAQRWWPTGTQHWPLDDDVLVVGHDLDLEESSLDAVRRYAKNKAWVWPDQRICFLCDIHADTDAFLRSLDASGGVTRQGPGDTDFSLTLLGQNTTFIIGGDCLDKGPANLRLLRTVRHLLDSGAHVKLLAGNHDIRTWLGLAYAGRKEIRLQHLFVRMGKKTMRLLEEVYDQYVQPNETHIQFLTDAEVRARLFPGDEWYERFAEVASDLVNPYKLQKELRRIREKIADIEAYCGARNWSLGQLHAAVDQCQQLFLDPQGEFYWFFSSMEVAYRSGSFLFIHAGVDDAAAELLRFRGTETLNAAFKRLCQDDLFELYHGSIGNCFRTKYRNLDYPLTDAGCAHMHGAGIYAIVHGHRNIRHGQRVIIRRNILNFECDASVDRNTRVIEQLEPPGGAVTIVEPDGRILGISADSAHVKVFDPSRVCELTSLF